MKKLFAIIGTGVAVWVLLTPSHSAHPASSAGKYIAAAVIIGVFWAIGAALSAFIKSRRSPTVIAPATRSYSSPFSGTRR